ncbi:MAG: DUF2179 domain-containing protein [Desulfatirhabdiaceae bacterium]
MDSNILLTGIVIFFARVCDVSIGTVRTIATVQGRTILAFFLGLIEVIIWISIVSTVVLRIKESPILVLFYAFGFATGNVVGILVEKKLAFGMMVLRIISANCGIQIADRLRQVGQPVTIFRGEGMKSAIVELYIVCRRRDQKWILEMAREEDPCAFYTSEIARDVSKVMLPINKQACTWRDRLKKK